MNIANLGIGTVQFGTNYGISNKNGIPSLEEVKSILAYAKSENVSYIDTAALYGNSEAVLGQCNLDGFNLITKVPTIELSEIKSNITQLVYDSFRLSLSSLKQTSIYGLLCHRASDLIGVEGEWLWQAMNNLKQIGKVKKIGVSVYHANDIDTLIDNYDIDLIQLPINVLDQRLISGGQIDKLKSRGIEVHARSIFLQGLLLMDDIPPYFDPIKNYLDEWAFRVETENMTKIEAAINYVSRIQGVDVVLVGVINKQQIQECIEGISCPKEFNASGLACNIDQYVNPAKWLV